MELDLTAGNLAPPEVLNQIFDIVGAPLADFADTAAAQAARATLRAASLVCKRWSNVAPILLEQCVHLPWTDSQLDSYTSRARLPATTVRVLQVPVGDAGGTRLLRAFQSIDGVRKLQLVFQPSLYLSARMPATMRCASLLGLTDIEILGESHGPWDDATPTPYDFRLERLAFPDIAALPARLLQLLLPHINPSLVSLDISGQTYTRELPTTGVANVRHLKFHPVVDREGPYVRYSLSSFGSLNSLEAEQRDGQHPSSWKFSDHFLDAISTLPATATLTRLVLPIGATALLPLFSAHLNHPSLNQLRELQFRHLPRRALESKEHGRAFLETCEGRGITVLLREDLAE